LERKIYGGCCPIEGCEASLPLNILMCRRHWFMVPKKARQAVWEAWGRYRDHQIDLAHLRRVQLVAVMAVEAILTRGRKPAP
jgi:hypothetical protein